MGTVNVEWIGVRSPLEDDAISYRSLTRRYNAYEQATLQAAAMLVRDKIRIPGKRARRMTPKEGLSRVYQWGLKPRSYVQEMTEADAEILFNGPNEYEFKCLENPDHADRVPIVPVQLMDDTLTRIVMAAQDGPPVTLSSPAVYRNPEELLERYEAIKNG